MRNAVLMKEFKLRFRSGKSYFALLSYLIAIGIFTLGFIFLSTAFSGGASYFRPTESRAMFITLSYVQLVLILFITPGLTAGVISGERERQTLNILLTTRQSSAAIILGKLISSTSFLLLLLVASLPIYSFVFLFGGVSPGLLAGTFLFYLFTILVIGSLGVMFSTIFRKTIVSMIMTYGSILVIGGGTAFFLMISLSLFYYPQGGQSSFIAGYLLSMVNPFLVLGSLFGDGDILSMMTGQFGIEFPLWIGYAASYLLVGAGALAISISMLRPSTKPSQKTYTPPAAPPEQAVKE